ncbi:MAG: trehalose-phosphatase, partial [Candidatus Nezhaarchaeales archaeon]
MPSYLYGRWPEVEGRLRLSIGVLLMLSYEGALVPAGQAEGARLGEDTKEALERLARDSRWARVVIVDSRTVDQLRELVGVEGVAYAGLDGMVIHGPWLSFAHESAHRLRAEVARLRDELRKALSAFSGVELRDRGLSLSIEYSKAPRGLGRRVSRATASLLSARGGFRLLRGRRALDVVPDVDWDRGKAVELL